MQFKATQDDVCNLRWEPPLLVTRTKNVQGRMVREDFNPDLIVNTSCEHMDEKWFYDIPDGRTVVLQTNDYFSNEQHANCVHDIKEALEKYKFSEVWYSGMLDTGLYNRFMIIGKEVMYQVEEKIVCGKKKALCNLYYNRKHNAYYY